MTDPRSSEQEQTDPNCRRAAWSRAHTLLSSCLIALGLTLATPLLPVERLRAEPAEFTPPEDDALRLSMKEALFDQLKAAGSETEGDAIANKIWLIWMIGPDESATQQMKQAMARRELYDFAGAHEILDDLAARHPDWAEVWNQRAFIRFLQERYDRSLEDIDAALALEPLHFGALAGKALVLMRQGRFQLGQTALRDALVVHPWARERAMLIPLPGDNPPAGGDADTDKEQGDKI